MNIDPQIFEKRIEDLTEKPLDDQPKKVIKAVEDYMKARGMKKNPFANSSPNKNSGYWERKGHARQVMKSLYSQE